MSAAEAALAASGERGAQSAANEAARASGILARARPCALHGWGGTAPSRARVVRPADADELSAVVSAVGAERCGLIARGAGCSYGDAAQNADGVVLDMTALRWLDPPNTESGTVRVGAGTTLAELLRHPDTRGLVPPVMPGTRHITIGGAIAADVHGKNHVRDGSFGCHVESLTLCTPTGEMLELSRERDRELFLATLGGMGLTGIVLEATLRLEPLPSNELWADIDRTGDLEGALALMAQDDPRHRYAIAWVDLLDHWPGDARRRLGRSVVVRSDYAPPARAEGAAALQAAPVRERSRVTVPRFAGGLATPSLVRSFNELRWRMAPRSARAQPIDFKSHFFPLDALGHWNRLYGRRGLVQYQFAVPAGAHDTLLRVVATLRFARLPMYLVVLKRFGPGSGGLMSFPLEGWTLAIDMPAKAPGLHAALQQADGLVASAGGRVYLAKDSLLEPAMLAAMYPALDRFRALRETTDPEGVLQSDMARRLGLFRPDGGGSG